MTIKTFHIFKAGTYTTSAGEPLTFTDADLKKAALVYSDGIRPAPLVVNHPRNDAPVLGRVKSLIAKGRNLYATAEFSQPLVNDVKRRRFTGVSAKWLRPDDLRNPVRGAWYLWHVGFLDGENPSLKDLEPVAFAEHVSDRALIGRPQPLEVEFAEKQSTFEGSAYTESEIHQQFMQLLMKRTPGMSATTAALATHRAMEEYKAQEAAGEGSGDSFSDGERLAAHKKILALQATSPGMAYATAAHRVMSSR